MAALRDALSAEETEELGSKVERGQRSRSHAVAPARAAVGGRAEVCRSCDRCRGSRTGPHERPGRVRRAPSAAAPGQAMIEVVDANDSLIARADLERRGEYSPMTLIELDPPVLRRSEVWPTAAMYSLPVLLAGGEAGILQRWHHAEDHSWWRWSVEFSNHTGRPADWAPPG